ncbi:high-affinity iron permease [Pichia californica]|uniref:High-affinity iron permease n=1 Tax=Pichia californica TaxID=460514 RepID=A0A9P7BER4_9ASCO|nr:high-affinity iron permease [[Candida] californica]KAG0687350.1 high-affinity iron permease [[Candida] californica]
MADVFNVQIFFIVFRESLEAIIVISVLLAFVKQSVGANKKLERKIKVQIWIGSILGIVICLGIGGGFIGSYYTLGKDIWSGAEDLWEGIFCIIATVLISLMGIAMVRINKLQKKWRIKIARAIVTPPAKTSDFFNFSYLIKKYAMFILPFITTLREGIEAVVFVGGVGISEASARAFPLPVVCGLIAGIVVGLFLYYGGSTVSLQIFLCFSTCILYLIAAGLFSRGVWYFQNNEFSKQTGGDASENGSGPGTYNIHKVVWHVNCCNPETDNGWDVFNALLGWQNSATYGSVISYNCYWIAVMVILGLMLYEEKNNHLPFVNFSFRHLNPLYYIKNKKKDELTDAEADRLFAEAKEKIHQDAIRENELAQANQTADLDATKAY